MEKIEVVNIMTSYYLKLEDIFSDAIVQFLPRFFSGQYHGTTADTTFFVITVITDSTIRSSPCSYALFDLRSVIRSVYIVHKIKSAR